MITTFLSFKWLIISHSLFGGGFLVFVLMSTKSVLIAVLISVSSLQRLASMSAMMSSIADCVSGRENFTPLLRSFNS